jgi:FkbM family methyltransferase
MKKIINPFLTEIISKNSDMSEPTIPGYLNETYSQCYEDIIIESMLLAHCRKTKYPIENFTYIEIGANHPVNTSSTFLWQQKYGMSGILVEANPNLIPPLEKFRPLDVIVHGAVYDQDIKSVNLYLGNEHEISSVNEDFVNNWQKKLADNHVSVPVIRVNDLFKKVTNNKLVILIIDVESLDLRILKDIDFEKHKPFIIEVEPSDFFVKGTSKKMIEFLSTKGYKLVAATSVNLIFQLNI